MKLLFIIHMVGGGCLSISQPKSRIQSEEEAEGMREKERERQWSLLV